METIQHAEELGMEGVGGRVARLGFPLEALHHERDGCRVRVNPDP